MSVAFYFDVHIPASIAKALRRLGVDVLTAQEDGTTELPDAELLDRATQLNRVLFTCDQDFLAETTARLHRGEPFAGVLYLHQLKMEVGRCVLDLELTAKCGEPMDFVNRLGHLPLR